MKSKGIDNCMRIKWVFPKLRANGKGKVKVNQGTLELSTRIMHIRVPIWVKESELFFPRFVFYQSF